MSARCWPRRWSYRLFTRPQSFSSAKLKRRKIMMRKALILSVAKRKLGKFFRMQYSGQNFDAVDNPRAWARKVSARVNQINLAGTRSRKRIKSRKFSLQFVIALRQIDIVTAKREHDDLRARLQHTVPIDLRPR